MALTGGVSRGRACYTRPLTSRVAPVRQARSNSAACAPESAGRRHQPAASLRSHRLHDRLRHHEQAARRHCWPAGEPAPVPPFLPRNRRLPRCYPRSMYRRWCPRRCAPARWRELVWCRRVSAVASPAPRAHCARSLLRRAAAPCRRLIATRCAQRGRRVQDHRIRADPRGHRSSGPRRNGVARFLAAGDAAPSANSAGSGSSTTVPGSMR